MKKLFCLFTLLAINLQGYPVLGESVLHELSKIPQEAATLAGSVGGVMGVLGSSPLMVLSPVLGSDNVNDLVVGAGFLGAFSAVALPYMYLFYKLYNETKALKSAFSAGIIENRIEELNRLLVQQNSITYQLKNAAKAFNTSRTYDRQDEANVQQIGTYIDASIDKQVSVQNAIKNLKQNSNSWITKTVLWSRKLAPTVGFLALTAIWTKGAMDFSKPFIENMA